MPDVDRAEFGIVLRTEPLIRGEGPEEKMISRGMKYEGRERNGNARERRSDTGAGQKVDCRLSGREDEELNNICKKRGKEIDGCL